MYLKEKIECPNHYFSD